MGLSMNVRQIFVFFDVFLSLRNPGKGLEMVNRCVCPTYFRSIARALVPDARNMMLVMQVLVTSVLVMQVLVTRMLVMQVFVMQMLVM